MGLAFNADLVKVADAKGLSASMAQRYGWTGLWAMFDRSGYLLAGQNSSLMRRTLPPSLGGSLLSGGLQNTTAAFIQTIQR